ncbi:MAG: response regulator [Bacillota bacterium]
MDQIRVLLVDDHALLREGLRKVLSLEKDIIVVGEAQTGEEALRLAETLRPDVAVMDISLPDMTGLDAMEHIKKAFPQVKILTLSIHDTDEYVLGALKAGARGYLSKDVDGAMLGEAIRIVARGEAIIQPSILSKILNRISRQKDRPGMALQGQNGSGQLTEREQEILIHIASGNSNKVIANKLFISEKTVKNHISSILKKLKLEDRTQLAIYAYRTGIVASPEQTGRE